MSWHIYSDDDDDGVCLFGFSWVGFSKKNRNCKDETQMGGVTVCVTE